MENSLKNSLVKFELLQAIWRKMLWDFSSTKSEFPTINLARCRVSISFSDDSVTKAKGAFGSFTPLLM